VVPVILSVSVFVILLAARTTACTTIGYHGSSFELRALSVFVTNNRTYNTQLYSSNDNTKAQIKLVKTKKQTKR